MRKVIVVASLVLFSATLSLAAGPKTYQVTGPVLEMKGDVLVVENRNGEKWEIAKDAVTKINGELKVGAKVTAEYVMMAKKIDVAEAKSK